MRHVIYIEPDEEITNIIDKLKKSPEKEVAIVAPKNSVLLQSLVNLRILQKETKKAKLTLDIVTTDPVGKNLAQQAGLNVFNNLKDKRPVVKVQEKPNDEQILKADSDSENAEDFPVNYYKKEPKAEDEAEFSSKKIEPSKDISDSTNSQVAKQNEEVVKDAIEVDEIKEKSGFIAKSATELHSREKENEINSQETQSEKIINQEEKSQYNTKFHKNESNTSFRKMSTERNRKRAVMFGVILVVIVLVLGAGAVILPRQIITITLTAEDYAKNLVVDVFADQSNVVDSKDPYLVGKSISLDSEVKDEFNATGKKDIGTKASGSVVVNNEWDTAPHSFISGTKFISGGKTYLSTTSFTVPGATISQGAISPGKVTVKIEASESGESFNIGASKFNIDGSPNQAKLYGQSSEGIAGGTTKTLTIVSQEDIAKAMSDQTDKLKAKIIETMKNENTDYNILEKAVILAVTNSQSSDNVGSQTDKFTYTVSGNGKAIIFQNKDLISKAIELAKLELDKSKTLVVDDSMTPEIGLANNGLSDTKLSIALDLKGKIVPNFNADTIVSKLVFKSSQDTQNIIKENIVNTQEIKIERFPEFWHRNPLLKSNIDIKLEYK